LYNRNVIEEIDLSFKNIIFTDLDNFKIANDAMGHEYGDKKIVEIASLFLKYFRDETIIRFGGDEFIIFSKEENKNILINKMNLIRKEFKTKIDKTTLNISYGISEINSDIENSIIEADSKMYLMKNKDDSS
jgi:diguanylate cyclase (GGDEF)-like protein